MIALMAISISMPISSVLTLVVTRYVGMFVHDLPCLAQLLRLPLLLQRHKILAEPQRSLWLSLNGANGCGKWQLCGTKRP